jgi:hypothetical protein
MKKRNLEIMKVKLSDLLYLTIVYPFVFARNIISNNTYTTILMRAFLILVFGVECVSIYVVPLICHNSEYIFLELFALSEQNISLLWKFIFNPEAS